MAYVSSIGLRSVGPRGVGPSSVGLSAGLAVWALWRARLRPSATARCADTNLRTLVHVYAHACPCTDITLETLDVRSMAGRGGWEDRDACGEGSMGDSELKGGDAPDSAAYIAMP